MDRERARGLAERLNEDRLVWIMGSSRSGSTWLMRMLAELEGAVAVDDPHIGHHLGVWRPIPLAWAASAELPGLSTLDEVKAEKPGYFFNEDHRDVWRPLLRDLIAGRFAAQAETTGIADPLVIVKEPGAQAAPLLLSLFPASRLVFLLRDGRDVVDSWLAAYQDGSWAQEEGAFPLAEQGREAFIRWQASVWRHRTQTMSRAFAAHDPARRVLVRYEDLLDDPATQLGRIAAAADVSLEAGEPDRIAAAHDFHRLSDRRRGDDKPARSASPGGWRRNLSAREQRILGEELDDVLRQLGYGPDRALVAA